MKHNVILRTKRAIRKWAGLDESFHLYIYHELDKLRPPQYRDKLLRRLNDEFSGENGFPIPSQHWLSIQLNLKTVQNVCDEVQNRLET